MPQHCLTLGGLEAIVTLAAGERLADDNYDVFAHAGADRAELRIELRRDRLPAERLGAWMSERPLFDTGATWAIRATGDAAWAFHIGPSSRCQMEPPLPHALVRGDFASARVYLEPAEEDSDGPSVRLHPFDELLLRGRLGELGGMLVHASGVAIGGRGYLFLGDSGAGKSTTASLLEEVLGPDCVYSDDRIVLRQVEGEWRMFGTPWHGTLPRARAGSLPLAGLCFLEQSRQNELIPLAGLERISSLLQVYLAPWWMPDAGVRLLRPVEELARAPGIGMWRLRFRNDASTAPFLLASFKSFRQGEREAAACGEAWQRLGR